MSSAEERLQRFVAILPPPDGIDLDDLRLLDATIALWVDRIRGLAPDQRREAGG